MAALLIHTQLFWHTTEETFFFNLMFLWTIVFVVSLDIPICAGYMTSHGEYLQQ
jgi:hypothetical protein